MGEDEENLDNIVKEKDDTIIELKNIIRKMEEDMERLKNGLNGDITNNIGFSETTEDEIIYENGSNNGLLSENENTNGHINGYGIQE